MAYTDGQELVSRALEAVKRNAKGVGTKTNDQTEHNRKEDKIRDRNY